MSYLRPGSARFKSKVRLFPAPGTAGIFRRPGRPLPGVTLPAVTIALAVLPGVKMKKERTRPADSPDRVVGGLGAGQPSGPVFEAIPAKQHRPAPAQLGWGLRGGGRENELGPGGGAVKPPRKIYWTERGFRRLGKPVAVPPARVGSIHIVYDNNFPKTVDQEHREAGDSLPTDGTSNEPLPELRTLWHDRSQGSIYAYNREGRVFVELLGDARPDGQSREHLGFEIADVFERPILLIHGVAWLPIETRGNYARLGRPAESARLDLAGRQDQGLRAGRKSGREGRKCLPDEGRVLQPGVFRPALRGEVRSERPRGGTGFFRSLRRGAVRKRRSSGER